MTQDEEKKRSLPADYYRVTSFPKEKRVLLVKMLREKTGAGVRDCKELLENGLPYALTEETVSALKEGECILEACNALRARFMHTQFIHDEIRKHLKEIERCNQRLADVNRLKF